MRNLERNFEVMPEIVGYELGNSAGSIDCATWEHDGVLGDILGDIVTGERNEDDGDVSAEELLGILSTRTDFVEPS